MRKDKDYVFELRREGKSYRQIQQIVPISRATLTAWFKDEVWSSHIVSRNNQVSMEKSKENILRMNVARKAALTNLYISAERDAENEYLKYRNEPLFWAGLMIYAGEGDKRSKGLIRLTNTEFHLHRIFIKFALKYLNIKRKNIKGALILYPDLNESLCKAMWSNLLEIPREQFHKTQVIQGKERRRKLQYGVGMSIICSTVLKRKMLKWLSLAQDEKFENAGMVQG